MLYGLQIAASNLKRFTAEQPDVSSEREQSLAELLLERLGLNEELTEKCEEHAQAAANSHPTGDSLALGGGGGGGFRQGDVDVAVRVAHGEAADVGGAGFRP